MTKQELLQIQDRINNPLTVIMCCLDLRDDDMPQEDKDALILKSIDRIVAFLKELKVTE